MSKTTALCVLLFLSLLGLSSAQSNISNKTIVYGSGLAGVQAGYPANIYIMPVDANGNNITTTCSGSNPFSLTFIPTVDSLKADCTANNGLWIFQYIATKATQYTLTIQISQAGPVITTAHPVVVAAPIFPPKCTATGQGIDPNAQLVVGVAYSFDISAYDEYGNPNTSCHKIWAVSLTGPSTIGGTQLSCSGNVYNISYYPLVSGRYAVSVSNMEGSKINGSPFEVILQPGTIYGANSIIVNSASLETRAGSITQFSIQSEDTWGNIITTCPASVKLSDFNVSLTYSTNSSNVVNANVLSCTAGLYSGTYQVTKSGFWNLNIYYQGVKSVASPYNVSVTASPVISAQFCRAEGQGLYQATAGRPSPFSIIPEDRFGNRIFVCTDSVNFDDWSVTLAPLNDPQAQPCDGAQVVGCENGVYAAQYSCYTSTTYSLSITYNGVPISNNNNHPFVYPGSIDSTHTTVTGTGLSTALAGVPAQFTLDAHDQYNNKIHNCTNPYPAFQITIANIDNTISLPGTIVTCSDGKYLGQYTVTQFSNNYILSINLANNPIGSSPFNIVFYPGYPDLSRCVAAGPGLSGTQAGQPTTFNLQCYDAYNNSIYQCYDSSYWRGQLNGPTNYPITLVNCDNSNGVIANFTFQYSGTVASTQYRLNVNFTKSTAPFIRSPVVITPGPFDPNHSQAIGLGVTSQNIPAGSTAAFQVTARDQYGNQLTVCPDFSSLTGYAIDLSTQTKYNVTFQNCNNGVVPASYTTTKADLYQVHVLYQGQEILYSPYNVRVVGGAPNPASCHLQNFANQATAGIHSGFYLTCSDQYGNQVYNCTSFSNWQFSATGPSNLNAEISSCDPSTGLYDAYYTANKTGNYTIKISLFNSPIQSSPVWVWVNPGGLVDSRSFPSGPGFQGTMNFTAGAQTNVKIQARDQYDNNILQCVKDPSYWTISLINYIGYPNQTFHAINCSNGLYFANIQPTSAGPISVYVSGQQSQVLTSPGSIFVIPAAPSYTNTIWYGPNGQTAVIGQIFQINVLLEDQYRNVILNCNNSLVNNLNVSMNANFVPWQPTSIHYSSCSNGHYTFNVQAMYEGQYILNITLFGSQILNIPATLTLIYGYAVEANTTVKASTYSVAGSDSLFWIQLVNQYGAPIHDQQVCSDNPQLANPSNWNATITPAPAHPIWIENCNQGVLAVHYNSTKTGYNTITIIFNLTHTIASSGHTTILPARLDPNTLRIANISNSPDTTGTFELYANDIFGNPETYINASNFTVSLTPSCVNTSVNCPPNNNSDHVTCNFTVEQGGQYCIQIEYESVPIILPNSHIVVYGGSRCPGGCQSHGFCFVTPPANSNVTTNTTTNTTTNGTTLPNGVCNCYPDYTGPNCNYTVSKRYMKLGLGIGLIIGLSILFLIIGLLIGFFVIGRWRKMD